MRLGFCAKKDCYNRGGSKVILKDKNGVVTRVYHVCDEHVDELKAVLKENSIKYN